MTTNWASNNSAGIDSFDPGTFFEHNELGGCPTRNHGMIALLVLTTVMLLLFSACGGSAQSPAAVQTPTFEPPLEYAGSYCSTQESGVELEPVVLSEDMMTISTARGEYTLSWDGESTAELENDQGRIFIRTGEEENKEKRIGLDLGQEHIELVRGERIDLSLDNWETYFESYQVKTMSLNAFEEVESLYISQAIALKDEYAGRAMLTHGKDLAFKVLFHYYYHTVSFNKQGVCTIGKALGALEKETAVCSVSMRSEKPIKTT